MDIDRDFGPQFPFRLGKGSEFEGLSKTKCKGF